MKRIPKASRTQAAIAYTDVIRAVTANPDNEEAWKKLFSFPGICFGKPKRAGKKTKTLASVINGQLRGFQEGAPLPENPGKGKGKPPSMASMVSAKLAMGDIRGAVRLLSSND